MVKRIVLIGIYKLNYLKKIKEVKRKAAVEAKVQRKALEKTENHKKKSDINKQYI